MEGPVCREYRPADTTDLLEVRNAIFPPLSAEDYVACYPQLTAALAYLQDEPVGAIPLQQRDFLLAPGVIATVAIEHAVGVKEECRSRGIGTAMIEAAREFLADRCDLLIVYRGGERSAGYRFYVKSGHQDLLYLLPVHWTPPAGLCSQAVAADIEMLYEREDEALRVFTAAYAAYGGHAPRRSGYWREVLGGVRFRALPADILFYRYPAEGEIRAYGLFEVRRRQRSDPVMRTLEIASSDGAAGAAQVMQAAGAEAHQRGIGVADYVSVAHPYRGLYRQLGFVEAEREMMIMGQALNPQRLFPKVCRCPEALADLKIDVWTPSQDYTLFEGPEAQQEITLQAKEVIIERLLTRRLDVEGAVAHDLLTIRNGSPQIAARLGEALPFAPWMHHHLDWL